MVDTLSYNIPKLAESFNVSPDSLHVYSVFCSDHIGRNPEFVLQRKDQKHDPLDPHSSIQGEIVLPANFLDRLKLEEMYLDNLLCLDEEADRSYRAALKQQPINHTIYFESAKPTFLVSCNEEISKTRCGVWRGMTIFRPEGIAGGYKIRLPSIRDNDSFTRLVESQSDRAAQAWLIGMKQSD